MTKLLKQKLFILFGKLHFSAKFLKDFYHSLTILSCSFFLFPFSFFSPFILQTSRTFHYLFFSQTFNSVTQQHGCVFINKNRLHVVPLIVSLLPLFGSSSWRHNNFCDISVFTLQGVIIAILLCFVNAEVCIYFLSGYFCLQSG